jgi:hypothetical protein
MISSENAKLLPYTMQTTNALADALKHFPPKIIGTWIGLQKWETERQGLSRSLNKMPTSESDSNKLPSILATSVLGF